MVLIFFPTGPSGGYDAVSPTIVLLIAAWARVPHSRGSEKLSWAGSHTVFVAFQTDRESTLVAAACPQQLCWLQPTTWQGRGSYSPTKPSGGEVSWYREEKSILGWQEGLLWGVVQLNGSPTRNLGRVLKSTWCSICQRQTQESHSVLWGLAETVRCIFRGMLEQS